MTDPSNRLLERLTSVDVIGRPIVAVPVGSCEQHGPHLPLGTDTIIATELAERLCATLAGHADRPLLVGPAITVSSSGEHAGFPGTLSVGGGVTETVVVELVRSADWAHGIVLVNGHGGNLAAVERATETLRREGRNVIGWWPRLADGDAHAGRTETSMLLAIDASLVVRSRLAAGDGRPLHDVAAVLRRHGVAAVSASGVLGDPTGATLDEGIGLLDLLAADLVAAVDDARRSWARTT